MIGEKLEIDDPRLQGIFHCSKCGAELKSSLSIDENDVVYLSCPTSQLSDASAHIGHDVIMYSQREKWSIKLS